MGRTRIRFILHTVLALPVVLALVGIVCAHPHQQELSDATHDLEHGAALFLEEQPAAALPLLEAAVEGLESAPEASADLVTALGFLGAAHHRLANHEKALTLLARARALARRLEGEHNRTQLPLVYVEAESLRALGRTAEAEERQRLAVELVARHYGEDSTEAALALGRLGEWHYGMGNREEALRLFSRAIEKAEAAALPDPAALLPLLQGMAVAQLAAGRVPERALPLLERMVTLTDSEDFDAGTRIEARLLYGDLLMSFSREAEAIAAYREAWAVADAAGKRDWLARLAEPALAAGQLKPVDTAPEGRDYFVIRYDLSADGRPGRVVLVESNASVMMSDWARQRFREMRFRPPLVNGEPRALEDQSGVFVY